MKKLIFFPAVLFLTTMLGAQNAGSVLYVAVKTVNVKASASFFAEVTGTLNLGDEVTLARSGGKWVNIRGASGLEGFAPADAFSGRRILNTASGFSATEFAMAGKGFSDSLEQLIRSSENVDYSGVDAMENRTISPEEIRAFLREGRLASGE